MPTYHYQLAEIPEDKNARELWIQHAAGFIIFEDIRQEAIDKIDPNLSDEAKAAARKGIDDAVGGLMAVIDGVTGALKNDEAIVYLRTIVRLATLNENGKLTTQEELDLFDGDGMCMGFHGWLEGDFGTAPVAKREDE